MELVMDQRLVWDPCNIKEVDEAKSRYLGYRRSGHTILKPDGTDMVRFAPTVGEAIVKAGRALTKHLMKILSDKGDERILWDKEDGREAKEAKKKFMEFVGKGYMAYSVDSRGQKNRRIEEFDVDAEEILMIPPTSKG
jgi:hypothetical protein